MRKRSALRGAFLVTMPLVVLTSTALFACQVAPESDRRGPEEGVPSAYAFTLLYAILHDDVHAPLPVEEIYQRRLAHLEEVIERESFDRIMIAPRLYFIHAREIGDDHLAYSKRSIQEWIPLLEEYCTKNGIAYDILVFGPASERYGPWCTDGPSQGYSYNEKKYLCLETFLDHAREEEDEQAGALTIHQILHGFGYNHISQENRPSNLLEWSIGLPKTRILPLAPREQGTRIILDKHIMKGNGFLLPHRSRMTMTGTRTGFRMWRTACQPYTAVAAIET